MEIWKDVVGHEGYYEVSNLGNVRKANGELIKLSSDRVGYQKAWFSSNGHSKSEYIHRVVARAFIGEIYEQVHHINAIKSDNRAENLKLCTRRENQLFHTGGQYAGTTYNKQVGKYVAHISIKNKTVTLGYFVTREEAMARYKQEVEALKFKEKNHDK